MHSSHGIFVLLLLISGLSCKGSDATKEGPRGGGPVPVVVTNAVQKDMPVEIRTIGTAEAVSTVEVQSQVSGLLMRVHFEEGDFVKRGDLLFSIDTRKYNSTLAAAQAGLAKTEALAEQARDEAERQALLQREGVGTQQEAVRAAANAASLRAALEADRAEIRNASLNVQFARITSPIDGRTGSLLVYAGNLVESNGTKPLVVIRSLMPIHVRFAVPERYLPEIRARIGNEKLSVTATPRGQGAKSARGRLTFVENTVDASTGTVALKAEFLNQGQELWPGQFVDVVLTLSMQKQATVIPQVAVQQGQESASVYVVEGDRAKIRKVQVDRQIGEEVVVGSGVSPGDRVVTDGHIRLRDGTAVSAKVGPAPRPVSSEAASTPAPGSAL